MTGSQKYVIIEKAKMTGGQNFITSLSYSPQLLHIVSVQKGLITMIKGIGIALAGIASAGTVACFAGANTLFNRTIPRQDVLRIDLSEMADMKKWEEYKKFMVPNREWLQTQELEHVTIKARDGITLHADYFPAETESDKLVICNHGYTGTGITNCASVAVFFHNLGYDCLIVDHRGHGQSEGKYIGFGILDRYDCRKWIEYIDSRFCKSKKIVLYGVSMGATTAIMTTGFTDLSDSVKAIIADCAFTSPYDVFAHILKRDYHLMPFPVMNISDSMCRKRAGYGFRDYSTLDALKTNKLPVFFIHGKADNFVPTYMSEQNYKACNSPKEIYLVENAGHGASYYENTEECQKRMKNFLEKYL